jgi:ribosome biogenesis protein YTM1
MTTAGPASAAQPAGADEVQVTLRFITKLPAELRVPETPVVSPLLHATFLAPMQCMHSAPASPPTPAHPPPHLAAASPPQTVPAALTRYGLSQIINHLLALRPARPFDFLVRGQLLRASLQKHLLAAQLSAEAVLEVEYVPAVLPPTPGPQRPHDDWVSAIAAVPAAQPLLASGCYDGVVRLWRGAERAGAFAAHAGAVKAAAAVGGPAGAMLVTGGDDCAAKVWRWARAPSDDGAAPALAAVLKGHTAAVEAVAASPSGDAAATGGWDAKLLLWRCGAALAAALDAADAGDDEDGPDPDAAPAGRKRRKAAGGAALPAAPREERAVGSLLGHTQCVSAVAWPAAHVVVSGSWDHSVRRWDPETGANTETLDHNKAVHCLAAAPLAAGGAPLVAFGGAEKAVRLWDPRAGAGADGAAGGGGGGGGPRALASHTDWVSALAWHPSSPHHLLSVSYDRTAKLWDVRAGVPLHTVAGAGDKLLAGGWVGGGEAAAGGADRVLRTFAVDVGL